MTSYPPHIQALRQAVAARLKGAQWMDPRDPCNPPANTLWFYGHKAAYGCFSNFSSHPITIGTTEWATTEHYFQAMKFVHSPEDLKAVRKARGPMDAAKMGRDRSRPLRADWEVVKDDIMFDAVLAKFTQHPELRDTLLSTGDLVLVEHTGNDGYWGDGGDGTGRNMLGTTLMQVRDIIRAAPPADSPSALLAPSAAPDTAIAAIRSQVLAAVANTQWVLSDGVQPPNTLWFYNAAHKDGHFSNFYLVPITIGGATYATTEHYFQAMKFEHVPAYFDEVCRAATPALSKKLGGDRSQPLRKDWRRVKDDIMFDAVLAKYTQHSDLQRLLLQTGDAVLVEHTENDPYWGDAGDGTGKNTLGITLMQVRAVLRQHRSAS
jgi:ribA/ribD-fused uncharacterized protein